MVQTSLQLLGADELSKAGLFLPDILAADKEAGTTSEDEMQHYIDEIITEDKVPMKEYEDSIEEVKTAKKAWEDKMTTTDGLKEFYSDELFQKVYMRAIARFKGIPSLNAMKERLAMHQKPDDKYTPILKKAVEYIEKTSPTAIDEANELFNTALEKIVAWAKAGKEMDAVLMHVQK